MSPATAFILYCIFALGGLGLYFAMPRMHRSTSKVGTIVGLAAVAGLIALLAGQYAGPIGSRGFFYLFATVAVLSAARVITHPKPVYSAIYVVALVVAVAALLVLQQAEFLAVALIIVYAGAILVTYLFVIMLAQQPGEQVCDVQAREPFTATLVGFILMGLIAGGAVTALSPAAAAQAAMPEGNTLAIGSLVMTKYIVVLQIAGLLLLISMVGAIALSKKRVPHDYVQTAQAPLGQIGREVEPF